MPDLYQTTGMDKRKLTFFSVTTIFLKVAMEYSRCIFVHTGYPKTFLLHATRYVLTAVNIIQYSWIVRNYQLCISILLGPTPSYV